ncbi:MAG: hypothetical protein SGI71_10555 [Verrucomicrobiota bacterium]|nr:hypothetical protein [Verrucomicrobiota bacterium]
MPKFPKCSNVVAMDADFCPRCGKKNPGKSLVTGIVCAVILIVVLSQCQSKAATIQSSATAPVLEMSITPHDLSLQSSES